MKIILAILIFSLIVIFHELGHFIFAKKCGIKVNEFCLGLGPMLFHFTKGETTYALRLLPFGGACVMEGEDEESDDGRAFNNKTVWQRIQVVAAGPIFNFILAYIMSVVFIACVGYDAPVLSGVSDGYPAQEQGLMAGDTIVSLNHYRVHFFQEIRIYAFFHGTEEITVTYERDGQEYQTVIQPRYDATSGSYLLGVTGDGTRQKATVLEMLSYGGYEMKYQLYSTLQSLKMLFTGQVSLNDMSGPVGIVQTVGEVYDQSLSSGAFYVMVNMLSIAILLSANLGVMNLLPIPALDGGRLLFLIIEAVRGKRLNGELEGKINYIGFCLLMLLMVVVLLNDVRKWIG